MIRIGSRIVNTTETVLVEYTELCGFHQAVYAELS